MAAVKDFASAQPADGSTGTTTWSPFPPDVLTKLFSPCDSSRLRTAPAAVMTALQGTSSPGSRSNISRSGRSAQQAQDPPGDVWKNPIGDVGIVVGQSLLGDTRLRPQDSFRMGELDSARIGLVRHFLAPPPDALGGESREGAFEADFLYRLVFP